MTDKYKSVISDPIKPVSQDLFHWHNEMGDFVECPCCGSRHNQIYKRRIYVSLVKGLQKLAERDNSLTPSSIGDFAKLRFFGLIEATEHEGVWNITPVGRDFLAGVASVPEYVFVQNNRVVGRAENFVFIGDIE